MTTRLTVLGRPAFVDGDTTVELTGDRPTGVLAVLAARSGQTVRSEVISDEVWEGKPVSDAALRVNINRIRETWRGISSQPLIESMPHGYRLVRDIDIDADLLRCLSSNARASRSNPRVALDILDRAARLWRGPAYDGFDHITCVGIESRALEEMRWSMSEERASILNEFGDRHQALQELDHLVSREPHRETAVGLRMVVLTMLDRRADALEAYRTTHRYLASEFRTEPGSRLSELRESIERGDRADEIERHWQGVQRRVVSNDRQSELGQTAARPFIGRTSEMRVLRAAARDAWSGLRHVMLIGEAGIGKSALASTLGDDLAEQGWQVLAGRCDRTSSIPFYPVFEALDGWIGRDHLDGDTPGAELARHLAMVDPELPKDVEQLGLRRHRIVKLVSEVLKQITSEAPALLVIDDAHWADPSTLATLDHLTRVHPGLRLLIVLVARPRSNGATPLEAIDPHRTDSADPDNIDVGPLSRAEIALLTGRDDQHTDLLFRDSGGNPLFALQLASHLERSDGTGRPLPQNLRRLCESRLDELDTSLLNVVDVAAVLGDTFDATVVACVIGIERDVFGKYVDELVRLRVFLHGREVDRLGFSHGLIRQAAYERLEPGRRAHLHHKIGQVLEQRDPTDHERIALHLGESRPLAADSAIAHAAERAAAAALHVGDYLSASRWYDVSVSLTSPSTVENARAQFGLGLTRSADGHQAHATRAFDNSIAAARATGRWDIVAEGLLARERDGIAASVPAAIQQAALVDEALHHLPTSASALRARLHCRKVELLVNVSGEEASASLTAAVELDTEVQTLGSTIEYLRLRQLDSQIANPDHCLAAARRALATATKQGNPLDGCRLEIMLQTARLRCGELESAARDANMFARTATDSNDPGLGFHHSMARVATDIATQPLEIADAASIASTTVTDERIKIVASTLRIIQLLPIRREQARLHELESMLRSSLDSSPRRFLRPFAADCRREVDDIIGAHQQLSMFAVELETMCPDWVYLPTLAIAAECAAATGFERLIPTLAELFAGYGSQTIVVPPNAVLLGHIDRYRALLSAAQGRDDEAIEFFQTARRHDDESGQILWAAWGSQGEARVRLGRSTGNDVEVARSLLSDARRGAEHFGSIRLLRAIAQTVEPP